MAGLSGAVCGTHALPQDKYAGVGRNLTPDTPEERAKAPGGRGVRRTGLGAKCQTQEGQRFAALGPGVDSAAGAPRLARL